MISKIGKLKVKKCTYGYDSLYRLAQSSGNMRTRPSVSYNLSMTYLADGRISQKTQSGSTMFNWNTQNFSNNYSYAYNTARPHTIKGVAGNNHGWDANGNMLTQNSDAFFNRVYYELTWDEENHLQLADMPYTNRCAYYKYDASGERFYKNAGTRTEMTQNGHTTVYREYDNPVLYASPYVVATNFGYTKHYYIENERIASRIGDGNFPNINTHAAPNAALIAKKTKANAYAPNDIASNKFRYLRVLPSNWSARHTTYWQHGDHLGSASWVTDTNGVGYQHLQYMPWGEQWIDQRKTGYTYNTRYTFSGKERDEETGFSYFGARYYQPNLSIWLSVDPMSDKYPGLSPYAYCGNNPIVLKDPDGRKIWIVGEDGNNYKYNNGAIYTADNKPYSPEAGSFIEKAKNAIDVLKTTRTGNGLISTFEGSDNKDVFIKECTNSKCDNLTTDATTGAFISQTILWNSAGTELPTTAGVQKNAITDLGHEFSHVYDNAKGIPHIFDLYYQGLSRSEWRATYKENLIRKELDVPLRTSYGFSLQIDGVKIHRQAYLLKNGKPYMPNITLFKDKPL